MKRFWVVLGLAFSASTAFACDTYTSVEKAPGVRLIIDEGAPNGFGEGAGFRLIEKGKTRHFTYWDAGTGTGMVVGVPDDKKDDAAQVVIPKGQFWFGPEKFVEYCK
jgi:hypothetical protein